MTILEEAAKIIIGDRRTSYGPVEESFRRISSLWSAMLGIEITSSKVALMMLGFKLCREMNKHNKDNLIDICGYAALLSQLEKDKNDL